ncbi:MAG TPA: PIN domain-containing protein [Anaerolineales bacterium]|nr:PIN domain-containing protein [Anaerolineales bacterium]
MGKLTDRLAGQVLICRDTPIFIHQLEGNQAYLPLTQEILSGVESGRWQAITSTITLMELTVPSWREKREEIARKYEALLAHFPNLELIDITRDVARQAAWLRARFGLRPAGALQAAAGLFHGAGAIITNDRNFDRLSELIEVIVLDDFVKRK